jgi:hypothetical protein
MCVLYPRVLEQQRPDIDKIDGVTVADDALV